MEFLKYFEIQKNICDAQEEQEGCFACPFYTVLDNISRFTCKDKQACMFWLRANPQKAVEIAEKWLEEHPPLTNKQKLYEVMRATFGKAFPDGVYGTYPHDDPAHFVGGIAFTAEWANAEYIPPQEN